jgi:hypothetical protein
MCDDKIEYKADVFDRELVTPVTRLGYEIQPKMAKRRYFIQK